MPPMPQGAIVMWYDKTIPPGWHICDGTNGTPDLSGRFAVGTTDYAKLGSKTGDAPQPVTTSSPQNISDQNSGGEWSTGSFQTMGDHRAWHQHSFTLSKNNLPIPATTVFFIMKIKD